MKCPSCGSTRTEKGSDFLVCKKCGYVNMNERRRKNATTKQTLEGTNEQRIQL